MGDLIHVLFFWQSLGIFFLAPNAQGSSLPKISWCCVPSLWNNIETITEACVIVLEKLLKQSGNNVGRSGGGAGAHSLLRTTTIGTRLGRQIF